MKLQYQFHACRLILIQSNDITRHCSVWKRYLCDKSINAFHSVCPSLLAFNDIQVAGNFRSAYYHRTNLLSQSTS